MIYLFGWAQRPVNRYKAFDCFSRAHSAGCAAATHNRAVCKWKGYGCKQNREEATDQLKALVERAAIALPLKLMTLVCLCAIYLELSCVLCASDQSACRRQRFGFAALHSPELGSLIRPGNLQQTGIRLEIHA
jgi:hypothetical protein